MYSAKPLRDYDLLKAFNETSEAQFIYNVGMRALKCNDVYVFIQMRKQYKRATLRFIRGG